jgi:hypothetical protein
VLEPEGVDKAAVIHRQRVGQGAVEIEYRQTRAGAAVRH